MSVFLRQRSMLVFSLSDRPNFNLINPNRAFEIERSVITNQDETLNMWLFALNSLR